ncbi:MAG TPA: ATP12 family protein [Stellaceae bacterium]|nr:ATP12 family protein [Stellaceae bacterium]
MKRFYKSAEIIAASAGYSVALDGRPIRTPAKRDLIVPTTALAAAIAAEWNTQEGDVQPADMSLTQIANTAIDRVAPQRALIVQQVADYAGTDLVCYRATRPPELTSRQQTVWQPLVDWAVLRYDAPLEITAGVIPIAQPTASLHAFAAAVAEYDDFALAAVHLATAACGSLVIALALVEGRLDADEAFAASQLDESFQIEAWGEDCEQARRRQALASDIAAAAHFLSLLRA